MKDLPKTENVAVDRSREKGKPLELSEKKAMWRLHQTNLEETKDMKNPEARVSGK